MQTKISRVVSAMLLTFLAVCGATASFGQVGYYRPNSEKTAEPLPAAVELANSIQWIYYFGENQNYTNYVNGYRELLSERHPKNVFGDRFFLDSNSKTIRDIQELIFMLLHEGQLPARLQRMESKNATLEEKLQRKISMSQENITFGKFLDLLIRELEIAVHVDLKAFEWEALLEPIYMEISLDVSDLSAFTALELALCQVEDTGYRFTDGILEIMPQIVVERRYLYPRVYPVADLFPPTNSDKGQTVRDFIATLETLLEFQDLSISNPMGDISVGCCDRVDERFIMPFQEKLLVAYLPQKQHEQLGALLHAMRHAGQYPPAQQAKLDADQELYVKLQAEISVEFDNITFGDMLPLLKEQTGLTFFVDEKAFECENIVSPMDELILLRMNNQSIETVLNFAMRQLDDTDFIAWNGIVYIAPKRTCENKAEPLFFVYPTDRLAKQEPERFTLPQNEKVSEKSEPTPHEDDFGFSTF